jgi:hypothetical protein
VNNVKVVDNLTVRDGQALKGGRQQAKRLYFVAAALILLCTVCSAFSLVEYQRYSASYHKDMALAQEGLQHLRTAMTLLEALPRNPFDAPTVQNAQHQFSSALIAFVQLKGDLQSLPGISTSIPVYGARLSAALHSLPIAMEASQIGIVTCNALDLLITRLHDPLQSPVQGLTMADLTVLEKNFHQIVATLSLISHQVNQLQPSDLQLDPRLSKLVVTFHKDIPILQAWLDDAEKLLPVAPTLLGIGTSANYLIEVLDSTELRPGGGFIGNYGIATFSGGRLTAAHITDTYLLDDPYVAAGKRIPYPPGYTWFDLSSVGWSLRDSNLDADFPTAAHYAEQIYAQEGGNVPVQGVIAITPKLIEQALLITGPINVPEYHETVTAQNLIDRIHYYQLIVGGHNEAQRKHFTAVLAEHFLSRVRQLSSTAFPKLLKLLFSSIHSKDLQIYFNSSTAESLLQRYHLDATIQSPIGDSLFVVDANISPNKANSHITSTLSDQVTIDRQGNAVHHTEIGYAWTTEGPLYGGNPIYRDYVRVYMPPGSILHTQDGWQSRGRGQAFGREVLAGFFTLSFNQSLTITLTWTVPGAARKDAKGWYYQYLIQRQAGSQRTLHLQVTLPSCAMMTNKSNGLVSSTRQVATLTQSLNEDMNIGVDYTC